MEQIVPMSRRSVLAAGLSAGAAAVLGAASPARSRATAPDGRAPFGVAVRGDALDRDPRYAAAIASRCRIVVPEGALKWSDLRPARDVFTFAAADRITDFARDHGLAMRGHTLAWYGAMPAWTEEIASRLDAERTLTTHIETVVPRYRGLITSWDVVNEAIPDRPASPNELRASVWTRTLGADYCAIAFRAAAAADPSARLVLNDYGIEYADGPSVAKRAALLALARRLVERGMPVHAVGLQGHLFPDRPLDRDGLQRFLREIRELGLDVLVTELDVVDAALPADVAERDARVAATARAFLSAVTEVTPPAELLTWGITDRYTWVPMWFKRRDGLGNRPLPLDADYTPKPLAAVVREFATMG